MATTSIAPAGGRYKSVEHAGECILQQNAQSFPDTDVSFQLPPIFTTEHPEPRDESTGKVAKTSRPLTVSEEDRYTGLNINVGGEDGEYRVFRKFCFIAFIFTLQPANEMGIIF